MLILNMPLASGILDSLIDISYPVRHFVGLS